LPFSGQRFFEAYAPAPRKMELTRTKPTVFSSKPYARLRIHPPDPNSNDGVGASRVREIFSRRLWRRESCTGVGRVYHRRLRWGGRPDAAVPCDLRCATGSPGLFSSANRFFPVHGLRDPGPGCRELMADIVAKRRTLVDPRERFRLRQFQRIGSKMNGWRF